MDLRLAALMLLLGTALPAWAGHASDVAAGNVAAISDRQGNLITVSNRFDGSSANVQITSLNRYRSVNWDRSHNDGYAEQMTSTYVDAAGSVIMTGVRVMQGTNYMWVMKYTSSGQLAWERADDVPGCVAFTIVANDNGDIWAAGSCANGSDFPVRLVHYSGATGSPLWGRSFGEGGRNYVRNLFLDFADRASLTLETTGGYGKYARTVVFDGTGNRMTVY